MNMDFLALIKNLIQNYDQDVLTNATKANSILLDLALNYPKERILARNFVEAGGYTLLRKSEGDYIIAAGSIKKRLLEDFSVEAAAADWIIDIFLAAMDFEQREISPLPPASQYPQGAFKGRSQSVAIGIAHHAAVLTDGTVASGGDNKFLQCDTAAWEHISSIACGDAHTVGLNSAGRVITAGRNNHDQCHVGDLQDIASIYAFGDDTICVGSDGFAHAVGKSGLNLSLFEDIKSIAWHPEGVYGIKNDGRVQMSSAGWEEEEWAAALTDVSQIISTYIRGSLVLKKDGRIYKLGEPDGYFAQLRDIVSIVDLSDGFAVLRKDGTVRVLPYERDEPRKDFAADTWKDITAIYGKYKRLIGLTTEGRLLVACADGDWIRRNGSLDYIMDWYPIETHDKLGKG